MIQAANHDQAVVSFYKRQTSEGSSPEITQLDLKRIRALQPDGIAWLHGKLVDADILTELKNQGLPIVGTMRHVAGLDIPLIREDDLIFASMVLSNFEARGHRRIGMIVRRPNDEYFRAKIEALKEVSQSHSVQLRDEDFFVLPQDDATAEQLAPPLQAFLESRPDLTGLFILAATGIRPIIALHHTPFVERMRKISLIHNVLDGVAVPTLPAGQTLAQIYPPLEKLGEQLIHSLSALANGRPIDSLPRLIPIFKAGDSLKSV